MTVERKVRRINRHVVSDQSLQPSEGCPNYRFQPAPEHSVMHYQEVCFRLGSCDHRAEREIDSSSDACILVAVCQLQTVQCVWIVRDRSPVESSERVMNDECGAGGTGVVSHPG